MYLVMECHFSVMILNNLLLRSVIRSEAVYTSMASPCNEVTLNCVKKCTVQNQTKCQPATIIPRHTRVIEHFQDASFPELSHSVFQ